METKKEKIINLRKKGKSYKQIEKEIGCSCGYISDICKLNNLNDIGLNLSKRLTESEIIELKEYYKTHTKEETSKKFNVSTTTVNKYKENKRNKLTENEKVKNNYLNVKNFRERIKIKAVEYKGGKCIVCYYNRCIRAFDFHHLDPSKKDFNISNNCNMSWDRVKIELDKCILVCSNCHREIHDGMVKLENVNASVTTTIF
jgi:transposase